MQKESRLAFVKQLSIRQPNFQDLPCEVCGAVIPKDCKLGSHVYSERKKVLFRRGEYPENIFIVCRGTIKLSSSSRSGNDFIVKLASPGDVLGMSAAIANLPYEVTAESLTPCLLRVLPSVDVRRMIAESDTAKDCVTELLARQHQTAVADACRSGLSDSITDRVASVLLKLGQEFHRADSQTAFCLSLTHQEIAEMVGSRRETVTRSMSQLRQEGIIALNGRQITLLRQERLEEMVA
jgi:CRP/FNR family cyclic AMP-dependent transcriptional regulator